MRRSNCGRSGHSRAKCRHEVEQNYGAHCQLFTAGSNQTLKDEYTPVYPVEKHGFTVRRPSSTSASVATSARSQSRINIGGARRVLISELVTSGREPYVQHACDLRHVTADVRRPSSALRAPTQSKAETTSAESPIVSRRNPNTNGANACAARAGAPSKPVRSP
jgi:hypothetical protein